MAEDGRRMKKKFLSAGIIVMAFLAEVPNAVADADFYSPKNPVDRFVFQVFQDKSLVRQMSVTNQESIERLLGKPQKISDQSLGGAFAQPPSTKTSILRTLDYPGFSLVLLIETDGVVTIDALHISGAQYILADGLKIGDSISRFRRALGKALVRVQDDPMSYTVADDVLFSTSPASGVEAAYRVTLRTDDSAHVVSAEWQRYISENEND